MELDEALDPRLVAVHGTGPRPRPDDLLHLEFTHPSGLGGPSRSPWPDRGDPFWLDSQVEGGGPRPQDRWMVIRRSRLQGRAQEAPWSGLARAVERRETPEHSWSLPRVELRLSAGSPRVMGILNVTPDSFSDGGRWLDPGRAVEQGCQMVEQGAALLDVGGESTRPGSDPVPLDEELRRVLPVIRGLCDVLSVPLSIDTTKAEVARAALDAGASIVNDTSALRDDPGLASVVEQAGAGLILMHRAGLPRVMQQAPGYEHCRAEVSAFLRSRARAAMDAGIAPGRILLDPGVGFGKRLDDNLQLSAGVGELRSLGFPVLLGASRKSFLGQLSGREQPEQRDAATHATTLKALREGIEMVRVHDVAAAVDVLAVARALEVIP